MAWKRLICPQPCTLLSEMRGRGGTQFWTVTWRARGAGPEGQPLLFNLLRKKKKPSSIFFFSAKRASLSFSELRLL